MKEEIIKLFLNNEVQLSKKALDLILQTKEPFKIANKIITQTNTSFLTEKEVKKFLKNGNPKILTKEKIKTKLNLEVLVNYERTPIFKDIASIASFFNNRYNFFKKILQPRLKNLVSIKNLKITDGEVSIIGIVNFKKTTSKGFLMFEVEDPTGVCRAILTKEKIKKEAESVVNDEIIGIIGMSKGGFIFIDEIIFPDLPFKEEKKLTKESYAAFISDTHFGSKKFMKEKFKNLLRFFNQNYDDEWLNEIAKKINVIFVAGDIVDGIGVYPKQEKELEIKDIYKQYKEAAKYFSEIPENIKVFLIPGNHDFVRLAQPQPPISEEIAKELYEIENLKVLSNPSIVGIKEEKIIKILMYHGVSIDTIVAADPNLSDGYTHPEKVMVSLLKKRHLSPQYESLLLTSEIDLMTIPDDIDVFHSGHVHSNGVLKYRGVTLINSGAWQSQTEYQKLCGHEPTPCLLPLLNLKTREVSIINFAT